MAFVAALGMHEVDAHAVDLGAVVLETVEPRLLFAPVVAVLPVARELAQVRRVRAVGPAGAGQLIGPARTGQAFLEIGEHGVRHFNTETLDAWPLASPLRLAIGGQAHGDDRERGEAAEANVKHVLIPYRPEAPSKGSATRKLDERCVRRTGPHSPHLKLRQKNVQ
jgi:hypothetical protein